MTDAIAYVRVSTAEQAAGGLGLEAQRGAIETACRQRGLILRAVYADAGVSSVATSRPGLDDALAALRGRSGRVLVVAKLDRLARSLSGYAALVDRSRAEGWQLLALDAPEASTPQGEAMQAMTAVFAQLERRLIGQRTREALAAARARGVVLGRRSEIPADIIGRIVTLHRRNHCSAREIARRLNAEGIPGPIGSTWHPQAVARVLKRAGVQLRRGRPKARRSTQRRQRVQNPARSP